MMPGDNPLAYFNDNDNLMGDVRRKMSDEKFRRWAQEVWLVQDALLYI